MFFTEAGADSCALFLYNGTLVCNGLGRPYISDKLLDLSGQPAVWHQGEGFLRELMAAARSPEGQ